ncbi:MAG: hypothetical protein ACAI38_14945 [Myxococcota bacterium]|nr:hypothetical protein [Myxococcota bacterium]
MSRRASKQLAYAARFEHPTFLYGTKLEVAAAHLEIERAAGSRVELLDQRTIMDATLLEQKLAKANKLHIAIDWIVTPEIVETFRRAFTVRGSRRFFAVLSSCVTLPSDLGVDLRDVFSILIAWDEVL